MKRSWSTQSAHSSPAMMSPPSSTRHWSPKGARGSQDRLGHAANATEGQGGDASPDAQIPRDDWLGHIEPGHEKASIIGRRQTRIRGVEVAQAEPGPGHEECSQRPKEKPEPVGELDIHAKVGRVEGRGARQALVLHKPEREITDEPQAKRAKGVELERQPSGEIGSAGVVAEGGWGQDQALRGATEESEAGEEARRRLPALFGQPDHLRPLLDRLGPLWRSPLGVGDWSSGPGLLRG